MSSNPEDCLVIKENECVVLVNLKNSVVDMPGIESIIIIEDTETGFDPGEIGVEDEIVNTVDDAIVYEVSDEETPPDSRPPVTVCPPPVPIKELRGGKKYICSQCQNGFSRPYSLKVHMRIHTGEKPYRCTYDCTKSFTTSGDLQRHVRSHTGDRPYKCTFKGCDINFTTSANLTTHWRTHTGERPYKCIFEGCDKSFMQLTNMKNHLRVHTGEKPYECEQCKKCFSEYASLYKHRQSHKRQSKIYLCPVCNVVLKDDAALARHVPSVHPDFKDFDLNITELVLDRNK